MLGLTTALGMTEPHTRKSSGKIRQSNGRTMIIMVYAVHHDASKQSHWLNDFYKWLLPDHSEYMPIVRAVPTTFHFSHTSAMLGDFFPLEQSRTGNMDITLWNLSLPTALHQKIPPSLLNRIPLDLGVVPTSETLDSAQEPWDSAFSIVTTTLRKGNEPATLKTSQSRSDRH